MKKIKSKIIKVFIWLLVIVLLLVSIGVTLFFFNFKQKDFQMGVTFSKEFAEYLNLDWRKAYIAMLDDLKVKNVRLSAQWNLIQPERNSFDFRDLDWQIREASRRGVDIILTVGRRTPRWPECHDPSWINNMPEEAVFDYQMALVKTVVNRYKNEKNIKVWQVENEPMLNLFGKCPPADFSKLRQEVTLVKTLDKRPVLVTDSGELSLWLQAANAGDLFGTTLYRVTANERWGYMYYYLPPIFYRFKAWLAGRNPDEVLIAELQAEPWTFVSFDSLATNELLKLMDGKRIERYVDYSRRTGFRGAYLWGVEWWYWMKDKRGEESLWNVARKLYGD